MKFGIECCLQPFEFDGAWAINVLERFAPDVEYEWMRWSVDGRSKSWKWSLRSVNRVRAMGPIESARFTGSGTSVSVRSESEMVRVSLFTPVMDTSVDMGPWLALPGVNACLVGDIEDRRWQNTKSIKNYEDAGRDHSGLVKRPWGGDGLMIDTSHNVGRWEEFPGFVLWAAAHMWFGNDALGYLGGREHLLAFPDAPTRMSGEFVEIELFDVNDPIEHIRAQQAAFRDWVGMDELEANRWNYGKGWDPTAHLMRSTFEGQPVTIMTQWYAADGQVTQRSKSVTAKQAVIADDGEYLQVTEFDPQAPVAEE